VVAAVLIACLAGATSTSSTATVTLSSALTTSTATVVVAPVPPPARGRAVVRGRVVERGTRRPLAGVEVRAGADSTVTDDKGRFELSGLVAGTATIAAHSDEHASESQIVRLKDRSEAEIYFLLLPIRGGEYEVRVVGKKPSAEPSVYSVDLGEARVMPGTYGDALKAVQNLPGTARTAFGLGGLIVRGSPPKDTKVYLEDQEIPFLYHLDGLSSVINAETLSRIDFVPGNFGARYGRAIGGLVELEPRPGKGAPHGFFDVDLLDVSFVAEAEVGGGGLLVSGRRSWVDTFFNLIFQGLGNDLKVAPQDLDYQLRYEHSLFGGQLTAIAFGSDDAFEYVVGQTENHDRPTYKLHNAFHRLQLAWTRSFGDDLKIRASASTGWTTEDTEVGDAFVSDLSQFPTRIRLELKESLDGISFEGGLDLELNTFTFRGVGPPPEGPDAVVINPNPAPDLVNWRGPNDGGNPTGNVSAATRSVYAAPALWLQSTWDVASWLRVVPGLRMDYFGVIPRGAVDPRLSAFVFAGKNTTLKAGVGAYSSPPLLSLLTPEFGSPNLLPERAIHGSAGVTEKLLLGIEAGADLYYKSFSDLAVATVRPPGDTTSPALASTGVGRAYGVDLLLRLPPAKAGFSGWLAYSLSRSERTARDGGPLELFAYDQTHVLTLLLSYRTRSDWTFGVRARYASGNPYTPVVGRVFVADSGQYAPIFAASPTERLPAFFQLDARIDKEWIFREVIATAYVDVANVTNQHNAEGYQYNYDYTERVALNGLPIIPSAGVRLQF
jgi:hypothetical protein